MDTAQRLAGKRIVLAGGSGFLGLAVAMIVLWRRGDLFAALLIGGLPLLGSASGRCIGLLVDGFSTMHLGFAALELIGAAFCLAGARLVSVDAHAD